MQRPEWAPLERQPQILEKTQVSLGDLIRNWACSSCCCLWQPFKHLLGKGQSVVEQAITAATVGREAGEVGRVRPLTPDEARQVAEFRVQSLSAQLEPARLQDEAASWGETMPQAWRELRELSIGLVDGSRVPAWYSRTTRGGLDEVVPPSWVVPHPDVVLEVPGLEALAGVDVARVAEVTADLHGTCGSWKRRGIARGAPPGPAAEPERPGKARWRGRIGAREGRGVGGRSPDLAPLAVGDACPRPPTA